MEGLVVVSPGELYLEALVAVHVRRQPGETLLAGASHAHQEGVAPRLPDHTGDPGRKERERRREKKREGIIIEIFCRSYLQ